MGPGRLNAVSAAAVCALVTTVIECVPVPQAARIIPGFLLICILPGFAAVRAVLPATEMSVGERLLASVGASIAIAVCASVTLGATVGLTQRSAAVSLGALTFAACSLAWLREGREGRGFEERAER